tara:strand:+ start:3275 stop:4156 length:882 start_codon:yes stop_codon:yes gene_type:complete
MNKKEQIKVTEIKATTNRKTIITGHLKCGDCSGLNRDALIRGIEAPCSAQGVEAAQNACPKYRPNSTALRELKGESFHNVASALHELMGVTTDPGFFRVLAGHLLALAETVDSGFRWMQPIYVRYRGTATSNYFSNFMSAYVVYANSDEVRLISADPRGKQFTMSYPVKRDDRGRPILTGPSLYSPKAFEVLKDKMTERGNLIDPETERKTSKSIKPLDSTSLDVMPKGSLDGLVVDMAEVAKKNKVKPKRKGKKDLVDIISEMDADPFKAFGKSRRRKSNNSRITDLSNFEY